MIVTDQMIEKWKRNPEQFEYDTGYSTGELDFLNGPDMNAIFKRWDCEYWRKGYLDAWAQQAEYQAEEIREIRNEQGVCEPISMEEFIEQKSEEQLFSVLREILTKHDQLLKQQQETH